MLGAWFRVHYPNAVDGVIAASAPIWSFDGLQPAAGRREPNPQLCVCVAILLLYPCIIGVMIERRREPNQQPSYPCMIIASLAASFRNICL